MNRKHYGLALALAAIVSVPAFAQSSGGSAGTPLPPSTSSNVNSNTGQQAQSGMSGGVSSGTGIGVTSGTGIAVAPASSNGMVAVTPAPRLLPGGSTVQYSTTTVMGGPAPGVASSQTIVTRSWVNVPADAGHRGDFQRWQQLK